MRRPVLCARVLPGVLAPWKIAPGCSDDACLFARGISHRGDMQRAMYRRLDRFTLYPPHPTLDISLMYSLIVCLYRLVGVGVGWQRRCKTCNSLRELDNQGAYSLLLGGERSPQLTVELDRWCGVESLSSAQGEWSDHLVFCGKAPTRQLHRTPTAVAGSGHTRKQINPFDAAIRMQESPPHKRVLRRIQLTLHATRRTPHGASCRLQNNVCLVGENPTCSVPAL